MSNPVYSCVVSFVWKGTILCPLPNRGTLEFSACQDLKNPWNDNKPVKISRDGQVSELESWAIKIFLIITAAMIALP